MANHYIISLPGGGPGTLDFLSGGPYDYDDDWLFSLSQASYVTISVNYPHATPEYYIRNGLDGPYILVSGQALINSPSTTLLLNAGNYDAEVHYSQADNVFGNNPTSYTISISATPANVQIQTPNLVVSSISVSNNSPLAGESIQLNYNVGNSGGAVASASTSNVYLSIDPNFNSSSTPLITASDSTLQPNGNSSHSFNVALPTNLTAGVTYYLRAVADANSQVSESSETDNIASIPITIRSSSSAGKPDLYVGDDATFASRSVVTGGSINVSYSVHNTGTAAAGPSVSRVYLSSDTIFNSSDRPLATNNDPTIAANVYITDAATLYFDDTIAPGNYYLGIIADANGQISELNETNNVAYLATPITVLPRQATSGWTISSPSSVSEVDQQLRFEITRPNNASQETVYFSTAQTEGVYNFYDYSGLKNLRLSFAPGESTKSVTISIFDDSIAEPRESFSAVVQLDAIEGVAPYLARTVFTIIDNDNGSTPVTTASIPSPVSASVIVPSFITGVIPTAAHLSELITFSRLQRDYYQSIGAIDPDLGPFEAIGLGYSSTPEYAARFGNAPNTAAFITDVYTKAFSRAPSTSQIVHFQDQINFYTTFYERSGIANADAELHARGAILGQILGFAAKDSGNQYANAARNFMLDASDGSAKFESSLIDNYWLV